jgi:hypothetical protein
MGEDIEDGIVLATSHTWYEVSSTYIEVLYDNLTKLCPNKLRVASTFAELMLHGFQQAYTNHTWLYFSYGV